LPHIGEIRKIQPQSNFMQSCSSSKLGLYAHCRAGWGDDVVDSLETGVTQQPNGATVEPAYYQKPARARVILFATDKPQKKGE